MRSSKSSEPHPGRRKGQLQYENVQSAVENDISAARREFIFSLPAFVERFIEGALSDARDLPVALLLVNILLTAVPGAICVAYSRSHLLGAAFCAINYVIFLQRYLVALLHVTEHRRLFKKDLPGVNLVVPYLLAPLYGLPSGMYRLHHRVMHHVEGNHTLDSSSTELYQRDSWRHFVRYWAKHTFGAWVNVPMYAYKKQRLDLMLECLAGETLYLTSLALICSQNPVAGLWLLLIPFLLTSVAIMFGNWSQHIFVDGSDPRNVFRLTYNCVDCSDNRLTFNDGYHIVHHLNSRCHWSELPQKLLDSFEQHAAEDAFVFAGIGFFDVGLLVMTGQIDRLASHLLACSPRLAALSRSEVVELMKSRLQPVAAADSR